MHNIVTSKMAVVLPASTERTNKGCFCRVLFAIIMNRSANSVRFAIKKQEKGRNACDSEVCSGFSLRGHRVVELLN